MIVSELWRYPVKSMAGEKISVAQLGELGIRGDRIVHAENARGRYITSRTHFRLLGMHAKLDEKGDPLVDGLPWDDPQIAAKVEEIVGTGARLVRDESAHRFDVLPLLVATDGAIKTFGYDGRRLRPNIVVGGVEGLEERTWEGEQLQIGDVRIGIRDLRGRCVMTTYDPDTLVQDHRVLKSIVERFEGTLALNCSVLQGGEIRLGDTVKLLRARESKDEKS